MTISASSIVFSRRRTSSLVQLSRRTSCQSLPFTTSPESRLKDPPTTTPMRPPPSGSSASPGSSIPRSAGDGPRATCRRARQRRCCKDQVASRAAVHYIDRAGLPGATGAIIPGALSILQGAVPVRTRGFGHMAPTYFRREPGIERSNGRRGSALPAGCAFAATAGLVPAIHVFRVARSRHVRSPNRKSRNTPRDDRAGAAISAPEVTARHRDECGPAMRPAKITKIVGTR